jgi:20S proteasome subunit beta 6
LGCAPSVLDRPPLSAHARARARTLNAPRSTAVAVAGADYCIVAASTRMSTGYSIMTRRSSKILTL